MALAAFFAVRGLQRVSQRLERTGLWRGLRWILFGSFLLNVLGVWWGLPSLWVPIEILPQFVLDGLTERFSHGWFGPYPPLHFYVLSVAMSPLLWLSWCGRVSLVRASASIVLLYRLVSVAMAAGIVAATCAAGAHAFGRRAGLWAATIMALTTPFLYYAKTANVDVPYLFWFALSVVYYVRILRGGSRRDYVLFAILATCAVCTKDQAYGLYLVMPVPIVIELWRTHRTAGSPHPLLQAITDPRLWLAAATAVAAFVLISNVPFNATGFLAHVRFIVGDGSAPFRVFDPTIAGRWQLLLLTLTLTQQALGWPFTIAIVCGVVLALAKPDTRRLSIWLLLPIAGYYMGFIDVILYNYDRFMLPVCLILALFGGFALDALTAADDWRLPRITAATAAVGYTLLYAAAVDYLMIRDSRYEVERWLRAHVDRAQIVGTSGQHEYLPNLDGFNQVDVPNLEALDHVHPAVMLFDADYGRAVPRETGWGRLIFRLEHETAGYSLVARFREPLPWYWLPGLHHDLTGPRRERLVFSTLRNINPTMELFAPTRKGPTNSSWK